MTAACRCAATSTEATIIAARTVAIDNLAGAQDMWNIMGRRSAF
jgi:hypothetical protein